MSVDVTAETTIRRPRDEVASFVMDADNDTKWIGGIKSVRVLDAPVRQGSKVERVASFLGRKVHYVNEVVELVPAERLVMRSVKSPFPMRVTYVFSDAPGGTLASVRVEGDASGFYKVAGPLMGTMVKRNITRDMASLRAHLERA